MSQVKTVNRLCRPNLLLAVGAALAVLAGPHPVQAQGTITIAADSALNYSGQTDYATPNGGSGFAGVFTFTGTGSHFLDSANTNAGGSATGIDLPNGISFGLYGQETAMRSFSQPLVTGETFSLSFDNGFISSGLTDSYQLLDGSGNSLFTFGFTGGGSDYSANGIDTGIGFTGNGINTSLTITSPATYSFTATRISTGQTFTGTGTFINQINPGDSITGFSVTNPDPNGGSDNKLFFNKVSVTVPAPEPSQILTLGLGVLGIGVMSVTSRRRRCRV